MLTKLNDDIVFAYNKDGSKSVIKKETEVIIRSPIDNCTGLVLITVNEGEYRGVILETNYEKLRGTWEGNNIFINEDGIKTIY